jgi:hypothetical protein
MAIDERVRPRKALIVGASATERLFKVGGASLILSGVLFLSKAFLEVLVGAPPSRAGEMLGWVATRRVPFAFISETLFVAAVALIPAVAALYARLARADRVNAVVGCGIFAVAIAVLVVIDVVHGRLVYPEYRIENSEEIARFALTVYYGGLHAVGIMFGIATVALSVAMLRAGWGRGIAALGLAAASCHVVGAYPWIIGTSAVLLCEAVSAAWFLAVGLRLRRAAFRSRRSVA